MLFRLDRISKRDNMKIAVFLPLTFLLISCNNAPQPVANANAVPQRAEKVETVTAHTTENQTPPVPSANAAPRTKWSQSGDPVDTKQFDDAIAAAQKRSKSKPNDRALKKTLAEAYFKRAVALTDARQY